MNHRLKSLATTVAWTAWISVSALPASGAPPKKKTPEKAGQNSCIAHREDFQFGERPEKLCLLAGTEAWVTPSCGDSNAKRPCGALALAQHLTGKAGAIPSAERQRGRNPGDALCRFAGGTVEFGTLPNRSQASFCRASDRTLIDASALERASRLAPVEPES
jgi:hypothetical protein